MSMSFLGPLIRASLGARGKRHHRAARYFGGARPGSFWNASTLLTALGLGVGAYEIFRSRREAEQRSMGPLPPGDTTIVADRPAAGATGQPPPLPAVPGASSGASAPPATWQDGPKRVVQLMFAAAKADGELGEEEYGVLAQEARKIGAEAILESERANPRALAEIVSGVRDPALARELYVLAFGIVRADEDVSGVERVWLARLASLLGLDRQAVERLERETAEQIDREPELGS